MKTFDQIAGKIIKEQELIIGPLAWEEADHVTGLHVLDRKAGNVSLEEAGDGKMIIDNLVSRYEILFGRAARELCKEAVISLVADLPPSDVPSSLK